MQKIRTAVIGVGYLGAFHAEKYQALDQAQLIAVCDTNDRRLTEITNQVKTDGTLDYRTLLGKVDAVSIAAPTSLHYSIAKFFLENKVHVLLEKPISTDLLEAKQLIKIAHDSKVILQIGHIERFNNVVQAASALITKPFYLEAIRRAPFKLRGSDANVVLDLMIHDIDLIQNMVQCPITEIRASGASIVTSTIDIAHAQIKFTNACIANLTASRVNPATVRKFRIYQADSHYELDLDTKKLIISAANHAPREEIFPKGDALKEQIAAFLEAILQSSVPKVSGEAGLSALATALTITNLIQNAEPPFQQRNYHDRISSTV